MRFELEEVKRKNFNEFENLKHTHSLQLETIKHNNRIKELNIQMEITKLQAKLT